MLLYAISTIYKTWVVQTKIVNVRTIEISEPIKADKSIDVQGIKVDYTATLVEVTTDEQITGIGEVRSMFVPSGVIAPIVQSLKRLLIGSSPFDIEALYDRMYRTTRFIGQRGLVIMAISGVEQALWDIVGKVAGQPVYNLMGGQIHPNIEAYASLPHFKTVSEAVKAAKHYVDMGFSGVKLHQTETESSKVLRKEVGEKVKIMLDVTGAWTPDEAIVKARELAGYNISWIEAPVYPEDDVNGTARVTAAVGTEVPICSGENEYTIWGFKNFIEKRAVNIINPDNIKCGGLWQMKKIAALAEVEQILCTPHSSASEVGLEAALHLTTSTPNCAYAEIFWTTLAVMEGFTESISTKPIELKNGCLQASGLPGFGVELDQKVVDKYTVGRS
jgi:L-alanine-DL-glutamate epimerase-like enolase superfamily enzyme